jgi:hypothetical protein
MEFGQKGPIVSKGAADPDSLLWPNFYSHPKAAPLRCTVKGKGIYKEKRDVRRQAFSLSALYLVGASAVLFLVTDSIA